MSNDNWKLYAVRKKAESLGLQVGLVRKLFGPRHGQNRIYINGHRCHLIAQAVLGPVNAADLGSVALRAPESTWANFVIYVPPPGRAKPFFVVPRDLLAKVQPQTADQLTEYADRWNLLRSRTAPSEIGAHFAPNSSDVSASLNQAATIRF